VRAKSFCEGFCPRLSAIPARRRSMTGWFTRTDPAPGIACWTEPFAPSFYRANLYRIRGRDADLRVDFGCGLSPLPGNDRPAIAVATHAHVDHIGGFHAFADRRGHAAEARAFAGMDEAHTLAHWLRADPEGLDRLPHAGFDLAAWRQTPAPLTATLAEGDRIDLGDRTFTVLHLPGHSPGSVGLLDERAGLLLSGDAVYDDQLVDDIPGADIAAYRGTMDRLRRLDVALVLGGHGPPFGRARLRRIAEDWLRRRA
jgi:glyoxylase-like metal-dependent hydrolase (beta-lactamase superfamily II)